MPHATFDICTHHVVLSLSRRRDLQSSQIGNFTTSLVVALEPLPLRHISSESRTSPLAWKAIRCHGRRRFEIAGRHFQRISESNAFLGLDSGQSRLIAAEVLTPPRDVSCCHAVLSTATRDNIRQRRGRLQIEFSSLDQIRFCVSIRLSLCYIKRKISYIL